MLSQGQSSVAAGCAPIAVFAFKRPAHLKRTLEALGRCALAQSSDLYIFSDAPRTAADSSAVAQVREIANRVSGFAHVSVIARDENLGLARSIIEGVTELCGRCGQVIVLEDDLVVAPGFLEFMNQALCRYREEPSVMQASGYMFPIPTAVELGDTFLCRVPTSWGWATWDRAWRQLELDSDRLLEFLRSQGKREAFNVNGAYPYFEHLCLQAQGKLDVWGVRWYASMFVSGGLCLYPSRSLVHNIGMDGSGIHCGRSSDFDVCLSASRDWTFPDRIAESDLALAAIESFLLGLRTPKRTGTTADFVSRLRDAAARMKRAVTSLVG